MRARKLKANQTHYDSYQLAEPVLKTHGWFIDPESYISF